MNNKIKVSILYAQYTDQLSYYNDWLDAFNTHTNIEPHFVNAINIDKIDTSALKKIENADLIILHHSMTGDTLKYLNPLMQTLLSRQGKLLSFVGNELNLPTIGMKDKIETLKNLEPEFIATQLLQEAGDWLYSDCLKSQVISIPHALNPQHFKPNIPYSERHIDIGTRSAQYGIYLGDDDRNAIIQFFEAEALKKNLVVDLGLNKNQSRFNREQWANFLNQCRATISTEAGSFYLEKDDKRINEILRFLKKESNSFVLPSETSRSRVMYQKIVPKSIRGLINKLLSKHLVEKEMLGQSHQYAEIRHRFFTNQETAPIYSKCISSRHFDAIGTQTLQVMFPGRFNDILIPDSHYVVLNRDFSNIDNVISTILDKEKSDKITQAAYSYIMNHHTYQHRVDTLLNLL